MWGVDEMEVVFDRTQSASEGGVIVEAMVVTGALLDSSIVMYEERHSRPGLKMAAPVPRQGGGGS